MIAILAMMEARDGVNRRREREKRERERAGYEPKCCVRGGRR